MSEFKSNTTIKISTERNFGIVFSLVSFIYFSWLYYSDNIFYFKYLVISFIFLLVAILYPKIFYYPNIAWHKLGLTLGMIIAPIIMLLVYVTTFITIGLVLKIFNKNLMNVKFDKGLKSYWIDRTSPVQKMKNQY